MEKYLVINSGSSSLKFTLYEMPNEIVLISGTIEKIGEESSEWTIKNNGQKIKTNGLVKNHREAIEIMFVELIKSKVIDNINEIKGVGHRILHGGEFYSESIEIDETVLKNIEKLTKFGPLHHPSQIVGIKTIQKLLPEVKNVAVFDTAFHQTMKEENYLYPIPLSYYEKYQIRKYGFHGTSHMYLTNRMKEILKNDTPNLILCHIGSGASITAIKDGISIDTSMGLTPLDGLMMGTRSGIIDPSIIETICTAENKTVQEVISILNKQSGLLGISGKNDNRDIFKMIENNDKNALLAIKMYVKRIVNYIAEYYFELEGNVDAIVLSAGVGENSYETRELVVKKLEKVLHIKLDEEKNNNMASFKENQEGIITTNSSTIPIYVIPTDEELMIVKDTYKIINTKKLSKILVRR